MNPNIGKEIKPSAKTPAGKFFRDVSKFNRERVPGELLDLYDWCKSLDTKQVDYLLELKNMMGVLKANMITTIYNKLLAGEQLSRRDIDSLRLIKDVLVESHKLKYGDKKVIEKIVTMDDVREQIFTGKKIIKAEVVDDGPVSQDMDRSGREQGTDTEDREIDGDNDNASEG